MKESPGCEAVRDRLQNSEIRLKVLHVIPAVASRYGGPSTVVVRMCRAVRDCNVDVTIATTDADGPGRLPVRLESITDYEGIRTIFFRRQFSESFKFSRSLAGWLRDRVAEFDCVHVHAVFSHSSFAAARACRRRSVPYIVRPLGALERWSLRQKPVRKRVALALGAGRMLRNAAAVHYTTEREKRESEEILGLTNGVVIPLGVDPPSLSPSFGAVPPKNRAIEQSSNRAMNILFLSRLHPKKGVEILLEAFANVVHRSSAFGHPSPSWGGAGGGVDAPDRAFEQSSNREMSPRLIIAGSGDPAYEKDLRRLAESLGIAERVSFSGWLDGEAKASALAGADLFVLPSAQENFGLSVLEAMAAGVAVAVSREVDLSDDIELAGAGWVFRRSAESLAVVLREAMSCGEERRSRGSRGRELVEQRYQWPGIALELQSLYRTIVSAPFPSSNQAFVESSNPP